MGEPKTDDAPLSANDEHMLLALACATGAVRNQAGHMSVINAYAVAFTTDQLKDIAAALFAAQKLEGEGVAPK